MKTALAAAIVGAIIISFGSTAVLADSESGGVFYGGGDAESTPFVWGGGSESGGAAQEWGLKSESGGAAQEWGLSSESGGAAQEWGLRGESVVLVTPAPNLTLVAWSIGAPARKNSYFPAIVCLGQ